MVRALAVLVFALAYAAGADAAECRFENAIYSQSDSGWMLSFHRVSRDGAANQTAAFTIDLASGSRLKGGVYWPNGYSTPTYLLEGPCGPGDTESCGFIEGDNPTVYVLAESGIERMPEAMDGPAPRQVLLPGLAAALWYSDYRDGEFAAEMDPGEVFALSGCSS